MDHGSVSSVNTIDDDLPQAPRATMNYLCSLISKTFDGTRLELFDFIGSCENAIRFADDNQKYLLMGYILSKLVGNARAQLRDKEFNDFNDLKESLIQLFGDKKQYTQLMEELNTLKQIQQEPIIKFYNKIDNIFTRLINSIQIEDAVERQSRITMLKELSLQRFIYHSIPEISRFLRGKNIPTLSEALNIAQDEERALNMNKGSSSSPSFSKFCNFCKKSGHLYKDCRKRSHANVNITNLSSEKQPSSSHKPSYNNTSNNNRNNSRENNNFSNKAKMTCRYCKKPGHSINECYKLKNKNKESQGTQRDLNANNSQINVVSVDSWA